MPKVSIVMPAYNSEKYITHALNSLINQTFSDWECIIVDDASTDGTLKIIKEFSAKDPRIRYKILDSNTGSAKVPRDTAINMAISDWVIFLDSDDILESNGIEKLLQRQDETGADFIILRISQINEDGDINTEKSNSRYKNFDFSQVLTGKEAVKLTIGNWLIGGFGLINKKLLSNRKSFSEIFHNYNMDEYDTRQMIISSEKVAFINTNYYLRINPNSITRTLNIKKFQTLYTNDLIKKLVEDNFEQIDSIHEKMKYQYICGILDCRKMLLKLKRKIEKAKYMELDTLIRKYYKIFVSYKHKTWSLSLIKVILYTRYYTLFRFTTFLLFEIRKLKK